MPRLPPSAVRQATRRDRLLVPLLSQCRDLDSAQNELRWLREHAAKEAISSTALQQRVEAPSSPLESPKNDDVKQRNPLPSAAESRWARDRTAKDPSGPSARLPRFKRPLILPGPPKHDDAKLSKLEALVRRRAVGEPLQYIIGDQPFGELEILCERNVLIPRFETEAYTTNVVKALTASGVIGKQQEALAARHSLRILDICTGSGAIALLLHQLLRQHFYTSTSEPTPEQKRYTSPLDIQIAGLDLSTDAVRLARRNLEHNLQRQLLHSSAKSEVIFREIDATKLGSAKGVCKQELTKLSEPAQWSHGHKWDIIISNPPYIAPDDYDVGGRTEKSVRNYEPRLALVPPPRLDNNLHAGDTFYPHILRIARQTGALLIVMEVGDSAQAERVKQLVGAARLSKGGSPHVETWCDDGTVITDPTDRPPAAFQADGSQLPPGVAASLSARAVVVWRDKWASRRKRTLEPAAIRRVLSRPSGPSPGNDLKIGTSGPLAGWREHP